MRYRDHLPQLDERPFLTDGGIETVLIFHEGRELPLFAAFTLLADEAGTETLRRYYEPYIEAAASRGAGPGAAPPLLGAVHRGGGEPRARLHRREPDVACQPTLGCAARLRG